MFRRFVAYHADLIRLIVAVNGVLIVAGVYSVGEQVLASGIVALQVFFAFLSKVAFNMDLDALRTDVEDDGPVSWDVAEGGSAR